MLVKCPSAHVKAFETDPEGQTLIKKLAGINNVSDRLSVHGTCDTAVLSDNLPANDVSLVIMDVEGYEKELLHPTITKLSRATILVEVHDFIVPGLSSELVNRFKGTHKIQRIDERKRQKDDLKLSFPIRDALFSRTNEWRDSNMHWLLLTPAVS